MTGDHPLLRVGLIGAGMVSRHHLAAWAATPGAEVVAVADPDIERAESRAREFGGLEVFRSAEDLIARTAPDALDIAAPVAHHGDLCLMAADRGVAILCQKPLAGTFEEAREIVQGVGDRVRFMVHENWRFRSSYREIKACLEEGLIGEVGLVRMSVRSSGLVVDATGNAPGLARQPFLADLPRLLVFEVLIHHIDVLRWLVGDLTVKAANLSRITRMVRGEDTGAILFSGDERVTVMLDGCLAVPDAPHRICDHAEIVGSRGVIRLSDMDLAVEGTDCVYKTWEFDALYRSAFEGAVSEFVGGISEDRPFETEARDNLEVLRLVHDVYAAAGEPVYPA